MFIADNNKSSIDFHLQAQQAHLVKKGKRNRSVDHVLYLQNEQGLARMIPCKSFSLAMGQGVKEHHPRSLIMTKRAQFDNFILYLNFQQCT
jgi:hypothetical protein